MPGADGEKNKNGHPNNRSRHAILQPRNYDEAGRPQQQQRQGGEIVTGSEDIGAQNECTRRQSSMSYAERVADCSDIVKGATACRQDGAAGDSHKRSGPERQRKQAQRRSIGTLIDTAVSPQQTPNQRT